MTTSQDGYEIVLSLLHEFSKTGGKNIDEFTLWLIRRKAFELQQQRDIIKQNILQQANEFQKQKEVKQ